MRTSFLAALVLIGAVAAILPASSASFTDTVTSSENTFSTGSLPTPTLNATVEVDTDPGEIELTWTAGSPATNVQLQYSTSNTASCPAATGYANVPGSPFAAGASPESHSGLDADDYCYRLRSYLAGTNWSTAWVYNGPLTIGTATPTDPEAEQLWLYSTGGATNSLVSPANASGSNRTVTQGGSVTWASTEQYSFGTRTGWSLTLVVDRPNPARNVSVDVWRTTGACGAAPASNSTDYIAGTSSYSISAGGSADPKTEIIGLAAGSSATAPEAGTLCVRVENDTSGGSGRSVVIHTDATSFITPPSP